MVSRSYFPYRLALIMALIYIAAMHVGYPPLKVMAFVLFTGIAAFFYFMVFITWLARSGPDEDLLPPTFIAIIFTVLDVMLFI